MPASSGDQHQVVGVVLAGGLGRRMGGGDKPLVAVGGRPMLDHVVDRLRPQVARMVINANGDPARFSRYALPVVADSIQGYAGPLAGILAGMQWAYANAPETGAVVSVAADTPFFPTDLVARLSEARNADPDAIALAASDDGAHPVFGLWPVRLAADLDAFLRSGRGGKILHFVDRHRSVRAHFPGIPLAGGGTVDPFFNVNTPEEASKANAIAAALAGQTT